MPWNVYYDWCLLPAPWEDIPNDPDLIGQFVDSEGVFDTVPFGSCKSPPAHSKEMHSYFQQLQITWSLWLEKSSDIQKTANHFNIFPDIWTKSYISMIFRFEHITNHHRSQILAPWCHLRIYTPFFWGSDAPGPRVSAVFIERSSKIFGIDLLI